MAPHGPILCEDEATPSKNIFKYLPGLFRAFPDQKIKIKLKIQEKPDYIIYPYIIIYYIRLYVMFIYTLQKDYSILNPQGL